MMMRNLFNKTIIFITKTLRAIRINIIIIFCTLSVDICVHIF